MAGKVDGNLAVAGKTDRSGRSAVAGKTDRSGRSAVAGKTDRSGRSEAQRNTLPLPHRAPLVDRPFVSQIDQSADTQIQVQRVRVRLLLLRCVLQFMLQCSVLQCVLQPVSYYIELQCVEVCCSVLRVPSRT